MSDSADIFIAFANAAAGEPGIDGGTRFLLEAVAFRKRQGDRVHVVAPEPSFEYLRSHTAGHLDDVALIPTPSYELDNAGVGGCRIAVGFLRRALATRRIVEEAVAGMLNADASPVVHVYFQDHLPETVPAFYLKKRFPGNVKLFFGRHLLVYSLFSGFRPRESGHRSFPGANIVYHRMTQAYATRLARKYLPVLSVANPSDKHFLAGKGLPSDSIVVTPYAPEKDIIARVEPGKTTGHASYVGRYHPQKGLEDLVGVVARCRDKGHELVIDLMGNLDPLREQVPQELSGNFIFHGSVYNEDKYRRLKESRFFIFPSHHESFGLVALEAMSCGVPVIAYDLPVYRQNFKEGIVRVPVGDIDMFADEVVRMCTDDAYHGSMCEEALREANRFDWAVTFSKLFG